MIANTPTKIPRPWASNGSAGTIPDAKAEYGRGSWQEGFPTENSLPLASGGVPPHHLDMNGVLKALSEHLFFLQCGGVYPWDNTTNYRKGWHVLGSNGTEYVCLSDNGPEVTAATGGLVGPKDPTDSDNKTYWGLVEGKKQIMVMDTKPEEWPEGLSEDGILIVNDGATAKRQVKIATSLPTDWPENLDDEGLLVVDN